MTTLVARHLLAYGSRTVWVIILGKHTNERFFHTDLSNNIVKCFFLFNALLLPNNGMFQIRKLSYVVTKLLELPIDMHKTDKEICGRCRYDIR